MERNVDVIVDTWLFKSQKSERNFMKGAFTSLRRMY